MMVLARLMVFAGLGLCLSKIYYGNIGLILIVTGGALSLLSYFQKSRKLER